MLTSLLRIDASTANSKGKYNYTLYLASPLLVKTNNYYDYNANDHENVTDSTILRAAITGSQTNLFARYSGYKKVRMVFSWPKDLLLSDPRPGSSKSDPLTVDTRLANQRGTYDITLYDAAPRLGKTLKIS